MVDEALWLKLHQATHPHRREYDKALEIIDEITRSSGDGTGASAVEEDERMPGGFARGYGNADSRTYL